MNDISAITVNWLTARRTLGAVKSIKKYYPKMPLYIIDDGSDKKDKIKFEQAYLIKAYNSKVIYDPDTEKLRNIEGTEFIQVPTHRRHGEAIDYAMDFINTKWLFHIDSDVRLIRPGVIEYMLEGVDDKNCSVGIKRAQPKPCSHWPQISGSIFLLRQDLYKKHDLKMKPIYEKMLGPMSAYHKFLTDKGYKIKYLDKDVIRDYYVHLRYSEENKDEWEKYY